MALTQVKGSNIEDGTVLAADIKDDSITNDKIKSDAAIAQSKLVDIVDADIAANAAIGASKLESNLNLSGKTVTLPAAAVTAHAVTPTLDAPVITGTLSVLDSSTVTHTIANWSDDITYTITPTNCTVGAINVSGQFVITHTSGAPSYTIKSTTASLGLADSSLVTKNIVMQLTAPTISSPADVAENVDVVYTITSTTAFDDKLVLDIGSSNFTFQNVAPGSGSKVGNTVEVTGFTTNNPAVTIQFTAEATYSVTAKSVKIDGSYGTSVNSAADSITCQNFVGMVAGVSGVGNTNVQDGSTDYKVARFIADGVFTVTTSGTTPTVEYLVVAGGGGGAGGPYGGGGGAGGYLVASAYSVSATTYSVQVGGGGPGHSVGSASQGTPSYFGDGGTRITANGGGYGNGYNAGASSSGGPGGSGGGAAGSEARPGGTATPAGQGYAGGSVGGYGNGSGGGGAGEVGQNAPFPPTTSNTGGDGGDGLPNDITGTNLYYAGGGAGGSGYTSINTPAGEGGQGGGGRGGGRPVTTWVGPTAGTDFLGGGGGGASGPSYDGGVGLKGGDGVVIVRYKFQ